MEKIVEQGMLYDFYGELLTEHQKQIYEEAVYEDFSLSEIAEKHGITRQGVHDLIRRCDKLLDEYERKLHLVDRFTSVSEKVGQIRELVDEKSLKRPEDTVLIIKKLSDEILEEL